MEGKVLEHTLGQGAESGQDLTRFERPARQGHYKVLVVGGGLSGICTAVELMDGGVVVADEDLLVVEQGTDVGGTWHWNRYPGAACDIESYCYLPFLNRMGFAPSKKYVNAKEISEYLSQCVDTLGVRERTLFGTKVTGVSYDAAAAIWRVETSRGDAFTADFVVLGLGPLSTPRLSATEGLDDFKGTLIHSSQWDPSIDLRGKTVGVVGTGSTGVQLITEVAPVAKKLVVFQRTPCWCSPRNDRPTPLDMALAIKSEPSYIQEANRVQNIGIDTFNRSINNPRLNEAMRESLTARIKQQVKDPAVAAKLIPDYPVGCKRTCIIDGYWPTFNRPNVELVADSRGVNLVSAEGPVTDDGVVHQLDVLVMATGYDAFTGAFARFDVNGVGGVSLLDAWSHGPRTVCGVHARGFPNMFIMVGPQGPGVIANVTATIQAQAAHVCKVIKNVLSARQAAGGDARTVVQASVAAEQAWLERCASHYPGSVWTKCGSWYNKKNQGSTVASVDGYLGLFEDYVQALDDVVGGSGGALEYSGSPSPPAPLNPKSSL